MREMVSKVYTADPGQANRTLEAANRNLAGIRSKSSPEVGVVSNFDPDQRGFTTDAMQGYALLHKQVGSSTVGVLSVFADYGKVAPAPGQNQSYGPEHAAGQTVNASKINNNIMRPQPGQPQIIYPVASGSASANLSFFKGGKVDYKRHYPAKRLMHNHRSWTRDESRGDVGISEYTWEDCLVTAPSAVALDTGFLFSDSFGAWSENSPLPPGLRYIEFNDMRWATFTLFGIPNLAGLTIADFDIPRLTQLGDPFTDFDTFLPHAHFISPTDQGTIRTNLKPLPGDAWFHLNEVYADDSYWTGEAADPLNWQDDYWDGLDRDPSGNSPRVDRDLLKTWLKAHPGAVLHE